MLSATIQRNTVTIKQISISIWALLLEHRMDKYMGAMFTLTSGCGDAVTFLRSRTSGPPLNLIYVTLHYASV